MTERAKAFSYLRFSTPEQIKGDSFRRQTEAAQAYAERDGLDLDDELTFRDLGVSAFRGTNFIEGALGQFIAAVDDGRIPKGSYLLVENLDRLSRDSIRTARDRFEAILDKGINIVTLTNGKTYSAEGYDLTDMLLTLLDMSRAHEESALKSKRLREAWSNKKQRAATEGHKLTSECPGWLKLNGQEFEVIEDRAAVVRRIFRMALDGHGKASIALTLNKERIPTFGSADAWSAAYIRLVLRNPAVIGRYQPMKKMFDPQTGKRRREQDGAPIEGYFPAIIETTDFYRIQRAPVGVSGRKGRPIANIFAGLVHCGKCGGSMAYVNKGPGRHGQYLACDNARRKHTCIALSVRYHSITNAIMSSLEAGELDVRNLLGNGRVDRKRELVHRVEAIDGQIDELEKGTINLLDVLSRQPFPAIESRLAENESTLTRLRQDKADLESEMHNLANGQDHVGDAIEAMAEVKRVLANGDDREVGEVKVRLNGALKRLLSKIEIGIVGDMNGVSNTPIWTKFQKLLDHVEAPMIPITVNFHQEGRHLLIYADPKNSQGFVAGAVKADEPDRFRLSGHWSTLIKPEILDAIF